MRIILDGEPGLPPDQATAVGVGVFDGVHRGHQFVLATVRSEATRRGVRPAVVTFDRHPAYVVRREHAPKLLTTLDQKLELLEANGVEVAYVVRFDEARAATTAAEFVDQVFVDALHARAVVVGHDFHFGKGREGDVPRLRELGRHGGFDVLDLELVRHRPDAAQPVTSTNIRAALARGDVALAAEMLGRPYEVCGVVDHGDKRGRTIGFPTANVPVSGDTAWPADGVYAGWLTRPDGTRLPAAISIGRRPTFYDDGVSLLEAYVLDFTGDLYGEAVRVAFVDRVRGQERFDSVDALVAQMHDDVARCRTLLHLA